MIHQEFNEFINIIEIRESSLADLNNSGLQRQKYA